MAKSQGNDAPERINENPDMAALLAALKSDPTAMKAFFEDETVRNAAIQEVGKGKRKTDNVGLLPVPIVFTIKSKDTLENLVVTLHRVALRSLKEDNTQHKKDPAKATKTRGGLCLALLEQLLSSSPVAAAYYAQRRFKIPNDCLLFASAQAFPNMKTLAGVDHVSDCASVHMSGQKLKGTFNTSPRIDAGGKEEGARLKKAAKKTLES